MFKFIPQEEFVAIFDKIAPVADYYLSKPVGNKKHRWGFIAYNSMRYLKHYESTSL